MPRYFMHLIDSVDILLDPDGVELASEAVASRTLFIARDCMANDVKEGRLDLHYRIEVQNEGGEVIHCLEFKDALKIAHAS